MTIFLENCIFFSIFNPDSINETKSIRDEHISLKGLLPPVIYDLLGDLIVLYFKNLTLFYIMGNEESLSNNLENIIKHVFNKHIKKIMRSFRSSMPSFGLNLKD